MTTTPTTAAPVDGAAPAAAASEMTIDQALAMAVKLHQAFELDDACKLYRRVLEASPDHPDALCFLGMAEHQNGLSDAGLARMRRAAELVPGFVGFHINLGNVLVETHRLAEAQQCYERAAALQPDSADIQNNLGAVHRAQNRLDEAEACFRRALATDRQHVRAWNNLGMVLGVRGDTKGAVEAYMTAIDLVPDIGLSSYQLGMTLYKLGQIEAATSVFKRWMLKEPHDPVPAHLYAACSGQNVPERASDRFIETSFDKFAASFEHVLNERLNYRAPQLCADLLAQALGPAAAALDLLDAGCGTGLCGPLVAPWARTLVGVDLSAGMLAKARSKGVYQQLVKAELTAFLQDGPGQWDAIVCADTLCYFGDLRAVMAAAATALRPGGTLVFTVEALPDEASTEARILPSGRYAHGRAHLDDVMQAAGLQTLQVRHEHLRDEAGASVQGWLVSARRTH